MKATRRQAHRGRRVGEELASGLVWRRDFIEKLPVSFSIGARSVTIEPLGLGLSCGDNSPRELRAAFRRLR
jgi:hypothetical protein